MCSAQQLLRSASAAGVSYPVAVRRLVITVPGRLSAGCGLWDGEQHNRLRSNDAECLRILATQPTTAKDKDCSSCLYGSRRELWRAFVQVHARYVRGPQSSATEVLGTTNVDLWQNYNQSIG